VRTTAMVGEMSMAEVRKELRRVRIRRICRVSLNHAIELWLSHVSVPVRTTDNSGP